MDFDFYEINQFQGYYFDQIRSLANLMVEHACGNTVQFVDDLALCTLLRDRINEAGDYLEQVVREQG